MLNRLQTYLQQRTPEGIALAFSGGVDSALLLAVLSGLYKENPFPLVALTICSVLQDKEEMSFAEKMAHLKPESKEEKEAAKKVYEKFKAIAAFTF